MAILRRMSQYLKPFVACGSLIICLIWTAQSSYAAYPLLDY